MVKDPLGLRNYSLLDNCNLSDDLKESIEQEVEFSNLLTICITEEFSVNWLYQIAKLEKNLDNKKYILELAIDEFSHFQLYYETIKKLFSNRDVLTEYQLKKESIIKKNFFDQFSLLDIDTVIYNQFSSEALIFCEIRNHYLHTTNNFYKKIIKKILADETKHLSYSKKIKINFSEENKEKFKKISLLKIKKILNTRIGTFYYNEYYKAFKIHSLDISDFIEPMANTKKAKDWIKDSLVEIYEVDRNLNLIKELSFDDYLELNNFKDTYYRIIS